MPFYLGQFTGRGYHDNPFRIAPLVGVRGAGFIDLRPDGGATLGGNGLNKALCYAPQAIVHPQLELIADNRAEQMTTATKARLVSVLGTPTVTRAGSAEEVFLDYLINPPVNAWNPIRQDRLGRLRGNIGEERIEETMGGTGGGGRGPVTLTDQMIARDFLHHRNSRGRWLDWLGLGGVVGALVATGWLSLEAIYGLVPLVLPATDAFTNSNGTALTTHSSSWTLNNGNFAINTNAVYSNTSGDNSMAHWNADTFDDNQYSQGIVVALSSAEMGVSCRVASSAYTGYVYAFLSGERYFEKVVAGSHTNFGNTGTGPSVSDTWRIEADGTTITPIMDGTEDSGVGGATTDSAIASGYGGLAGWGTGTATRLDNWEGGNLGGGGGGPDKASILSYHLRSVYNRS